jgi:hypothetical protein
LRATRVAPTLKSAQGLRQTLGKCLGEPNDLENSEDRRSAGRHGNQHVRLRDAQVSEAFCPALAINRCEPWQALLSGFRFFLP